MILKCTRSARVCGLRSMGTGRGMPADASTCIISAAQLAEAQIDTLVTAVLQVSCSSCPLVQVRLQVPLVTSPPCCCGRNVRGKCKIHTSETKTSTSVASSLPLVWCSAREKIDRFGRYGEMVASARTIAADSTAVKRASNLQACNPHETHSAQGHGPNVSRHFIATGLVQDAGKDGRVGRCGDIVASASTMAADSKALRRAINLLQSHASYAPQSLSGIGMIARNGPTIHPPISTHD